MEWLLPIVGVLGIGGTIAAAIMFPAVVIPALQAVMRCKPCLYALAIIGAMGASWWHGNHTASVACRADQLAAELRNKEADVEAARKAASDETDRANKIEADSNDRQAKDAVYIKSLESRPGCALTDDDIVGVPNNDSKKPPPDTK